MPKIREASYRHVNEQQL